MTGSTAVVATTTAQFTITVPSNTATSSARNAAYVSTATQSVVITLQSVNGVKYAGYAGSPGLIATNLTPSNPACSGVPLTCTANAPAAPGSDVFNVATYDTAQASTTPTTPIGNLLSQATLTVTVTSGKANAVSTPLVLNGVPSTVTMSGLPAATAGTAFASAQTFTVTVQDAGGKTIVGTYSTAVTLTDGDTSGATTIATSGTDSPTSGQLLSSSDTATLNYTGLAIAPATITAKSGGVTVGTGTFTPVLQPIVTNAPLNGTTPEIALTRDTMNQAFTATEVGWTNAPYNNKITATSATGCSTIGTTTPAAGTSFTSTKVTTPVAGTCSLTLSDFTGGSTLVVTLAWVTGTQTFTYTAPGGAQTFTVPFGVSTVTVAATGAGGGAGFNAVAAGGFGGAVTATIPVVVPSTLTVLVGGVGGAAPDAMTNGAAGFNGGGAGGNGGGGGGGASTVAVVAGTPVVAAGGGGGGGALATGGAGGAGGGAAGVGTAGAAGGGGDNLGGSGATQLAVGAFGTGATAASNGLPGVLGVGGAGGGVNPVAGGGGGGGGYFGGGGGGGGSATPAGAGGGGGSSFAEATATSVTYPAPATTTSGQIVLTW